ncbi:histidine kinase N-terminal 7TM domain-containing protein [Candidatus Omnitrophota bacterium]
MYILPLIFFFSFLIHIYLSVIILANHTKSNLHRSCAMLLSCFALWSLSAGLAQFPFGREDTTRLFYNISSIGWISFAGFFLWFALIFNGKEKRLKAKYICPPLFALAILLIYKQWTGYLLTDFTKQSYGWSFSWSGSIWSYIFQFYYLAALFLGLGLIIRKKSKSANERKQAAIIFITSLIALIIGSLSDVVLPELNIFVIPPLGAVTTLIWACGLVYAMVRYKFLAITPHSAAEYIISTMKESLFLLDERSAVVNVNQAGADLLNGTKKELIGRSFTELFPEARSLSAKFSQAETINNLDFTLKRETGQTVSLLLSSSVLRQDSSELAGFVCVIRDITERKQAQAELQASEQELKKQVRQLERFHKVAVDRELKMIELKDKIRRLEARLG